VKVVPQLTRVREETSLENRVFGWSPPVNHVRGRKGGLFNLSEEVVGILGEEKASNFLVREVFYIPVLGQIKDVVYRR
jgi:hypothetical protein